MADCSSIYLVCFRRDMRAHVGFQRRKRKRLVNDAISRSAQHGQFRPDLSSLLRRDAFRVMVDLQSSVVVRWPRTFALPQLIRERADPRSDTDALQLAGVLKLQPK
jgi:hypothetical protein